MTENFKFGKNKNKNNNQPEDSMLEQTPKRIHPNKSIPRHIILKLLKTKDKEVFEVCERGDTLSIGENNLNHSGFHIRTTETRKK